MYFVVTCASCPLHFAFGFDFGIDRYSGIRKSGKEMMMRQRDHSGSDTGCYQGVMLSGCDAGDAIGRQVALIYIDDKLSFRVTVDLRNLKEKFMNLVFVCMLYR